MRTTPPKLPRDLRKIGPQVLEVIRTSERKTIYYEKLLRRVGAEGALIGKSVIWLTAQGLINIEMQPTTTGGYTEPVCIAANA